MARQDTSPLAFRALCWAAREAPMQDLTKGPISRNVLQMTGFLLVTMLFQTLYFLVDLYFVGRLGKSAAAALNVSGNLTFVVLAASQTLGVGTTSLIAQATGRKDQAGVRLMFNQSQGLAVAVGALFLLVMTGVRDWYTSRSAADPTTARLASEYLSLYIPAMALQFPMAASLSALRGTGNFKPGTVIQSATVLLNIALAPVFIFGWGTGRPMGVRGAALATFIAVVVAVVAVAFYVARRERYLAFIVSEMKPRLALWGRMLRIGLPAGAEFALMGVYMTAITYLIRPFGSAAQAGFGVGARVMQACFLPVVALAFAASPVAGQNFGARQGQRVRDTFSWAARMATIYMVVLTVLFHLVPAGLVRFFQNDPQVVAVGSEYLRLISWNFVGSGLVFVSSSMFQAMGNTIPPSLASLVRVVLLVIPAFALASLPGFQLRWIWYLSIPSVLAQVAFSLLLLRREFARRLVFAPDPVPAASVPAAE
jgi:putative MATE family efflux protein